jgi:hypothetical protein
MYSKISIEKYIYIHLYDDILNCYSNFYEKQDYNFNIKKKMLLLKQKKEIFKYIDVNI